MGVYNLPLSEDQDASRQRPVLRGSLPESLLRESELWFCRLRWMVIAILVTFGALSYSPSLFRAIELQPYLRWPFVVSGILAGSNLLFWWHGQRLKRPAGPSTVTVNLWGQVLVDLVLLTAVVHYTGSLGTNIAFAYLFHIVLSCIFLTRTHSFLVTALAGILYVTCVAVETSGLIPPESVFLDTTVRESIQLQPTRVYLDVLSALLVWLVIWYLASNLSAMVRRRDVELARTNRRLEQAQKERTRHMLHTTHEIKAPFAAIVANVQLLLHGYCGELSDDARDTLERISARSNRLASEIQEMLQLANLRSKSENPPEQEAVDLTEVLRWAIEESRASAEKRDLSLETDLSPLTVNGVEEQLKMLFHNLVSNAVFYSESGGTVRVQTTENDEGLPMAIIEDSGIGIPEGKLPEIFKEYYRTNEAVRHHKESTGLGLAIVRHIADAHRIRLSVQSAPGEGTIFRLTFPSLSGSSQPSTNP